jgi:hypothetical protein
VCGFLPVMVMNHGEFGMDLWSRSVPSGSSEGPQVDVETVSGIGLWQTTADPAEGNGLEGDLDQGAQVVGAVTSCDNVGSRALQDCVEALTYVNVMLQEVPGTVIRSLNDSGSQFSIVNKEALRDHSTLFVGL